MDAHNLTMGLIGIGIVIVMMHLDLDLDVEEFAQEPLSSQDLCHSIVGSDRCIVNAIASHVDTQAAASASHAPNFDLHWGSMPSPLSS